MMSPPPANRPGVLRRPSKDGTVSLIVVDSHPRTVSALAGAAGGSHPRVSGQSSETVMVTSMLPRVAFEYGHTW
jgi:hypothetical protein